MRNSRAVRWYVLALPSRHRGAAKGLQAELDRRLRNGEPAFEYFAPTYVEVREEKGVWVKTARPLLYNYVFVRSSENEIYKMMSTAGLSLYSFLPRVRDGKREYYPYLSDEAMENLRWVARSYADIVPVYTPEPKRLMKGDRVRITEGKFKNAEATVISQPGGGRKDIMVCVENWLWVPLLHVQPGQYEIISLNTDNMHVYTRLNNDRLFEALHEAMQRHHAGGATSEDRALATETLQQYASLRMDSDVTRCKLYALLLPAYTILGDQEACNRMIGEIQGLCCPLSGRSSRGHCCRLRSMDVPTTAFIANRRTESSTAGARRSVPRKSKRNLSGVWTTTTNGWDIADKRNARNYPKSYERTAAGKRALRNTTDASDGDAATRHHPSGA